MLGSLTPPKGPDVGLEMGIRSLLGFILLQAGNGWAVRVCDFSSIISIGEKEKRKGGKGFSHLRTEPELIPNETSTWCAVCALGQLGGLRGGSSAVGVTPSPCILWQMVGGCCCCPSLVEYPSPEEVMLCRCASRSPFPPAGSQHSPGRGGGARHDAACLSVFLPLCNSFGLVERGFVCSAVQSGAPASAFGGFAVKML